MSRSVLTWRGPYGGHYPSLASTVYLGQEEFLRHALDAYNAAKRDMQPDPGQPWLTADGAAWATAENFHDCLVQRVRDRLRRRARLTGHQVESEIEDDASENNYWPDSGAGWSPADMGHGWPASAAGGPSIPATQGVNGPLSPTAVPSSLEIAE